MSVTARIAEEGPRLPATAAPRQSAGPPIAYDLSCPCCRAWYRGASDHAAATFLTDHTHPVLSRVPQRIAQVVALVTWTRH